MNTVDQRITLARRWAAAEVPFLHQGRNEYGSDCIGLLVYCTGYPEDEIPSYSRDPHNGLLEWHLEAAFGAPVCTAGPEGVQVGQLRPGDLVALAYGRAVRHVGVIALHPVHAGCLSLIHTDSSVGKVTEHILDEPWLKRIRKVHR